MYFYLFVCLAFFEVFVLFERFFLFGAFLGFCFWLVGLGFGVFLCKISAKQECNGCNLFSHVKEENQKAGIKLT